MDSQSSVRRYPSVEEMPDFVTPEEAAVVLRLGRNSMYTALQTGQVPSIRIGRKLLIPKTALQRMRDAGPSEG